MSGKRTSQELFSNSEKWEFTSKAKSSTQEKWRSIIEQVENYVDEIFEDDADEAGSDTTSTEDEVAGGTDLRRFLQNLKERIHVEPVSQLALVGENGIGKSFLANLLLQLTAQTDSDTAYGLLPVKQGMEDSGNRNLKALRSELLLLANLSAMGDLENHLRESDAKEFSSVLDEDSGKSLEFLDYVLDNDIMLYESDMDTQGKIVSEERRLKEIVDLQNLKKAWKTWPSGDMEKSQYILPSLQGIRSTTANQINIRHGTIFHFWIRYKSKLRLQGELASIVDSLQNLDADLEASEKRRLKAKFEVLTGQKFKLKEADAAGLCERLKEVMGKDVIVSGRGFHPLDDRIYVRDKLKERLTDKTQSCAIEQCCVYCPSELLERGLELIDTPGANDADPYKFDVLVKTLTEASNVLCVSKRCLEADSSLLTVLQDCDVFKRILQPEPNRPFEFVMFWSANEKENGMAANNVANAFQKESPVKVNLETGARDLFEGLRKELEEKAEDLDIDMDENTIQETMRKQEEKVMCGLALLWASLCMDEQEARRELDSLVQGRYDFVYEKTNGQALLRALFNIRPKPDNVLVQFLKYVRTSSYGIISGKDLIPATTLERLKRKLELDDVKGIEKRYQERVMNKLWSRLKAAVGEENGQLKAFCAPITAEAEPHKISQRVTKFVRDTQKARREPLTKAFDIKTDTTSSIGVWNKTFAGWFPKPQSQEVDDLVTSLNTMLNLLVIEPPDAVVEENRARAQLVVDVEEWLMEEMLLLYGPSKAADQDALRAKILPVLQTTAKRMLETTRWQPNSKVGWVPKSSVYKLVDRAKVKSVKTLCEKASGRINELKGKPDWRDGYAEAFSEKNMEELVRDLATELRREAGKVVTARVEAAASKALVGLKKGRRQSTLSTFSSKVVAACAADVLNAFEPDPARKKKHDELLTMCDDVEEFVHDQMMFQNEEHEFKALLKRVKTAGAREEAAPELFPPGWEKKGGKGRKKKRRKTGGDDE